MPGTTWTTPANVAVGSADSATVQNAQVVQNLLTLWASALGTKNAVINGNADMWQRGTSFTFAAGTAWGGAGGLSGTWTGAASGATADRWLYCTNGSTTTAGVISRTTLVLGTTVGRDVYAFNWSRTAAGTQTSTFEHHMESVATYAGQTVTVSFTAKATSSTQPIDVSLVQNFGVGGAPSANVTTAVLTNQAITTAPARFQFTVTLPSIASKVIGTTAGTDFLSLVFGRQTGYANGAIDIWGIQVELGTAATTFEYVPVQVTLAQCQRYYWRTVTSGLWGNGYAFSTVLAAFVLKHPATMRAAPTLGTSSAAAIVIASGAAPTFTASSSIATLFLTVDAWSGTAGTTGLTANAGILFGSNTAGWVDFSAEL